MSRRRQVDRREVEASAGEQAWSHAATGGPCPGRCNAGYRAAAEEVEPVPGRPVWCLPCQDRIATAAARLPELAVELAARPLGRLAETGRTDRPVQSTAIVSPSGSPAWDACEEVIEWAWSCAGLLLQRLGQDPPRAWWASSSAPVASLSTSVGVLTCHLQAWLSGPDAVDEGRAALRLAAEAERNVGADRLVHRLPAPCPYCDTLTLAREDGEDQVWCRRCQRAWTEQDYKRLVRILTDEQKEA